MQPPTWTVYSPEIDSSHTGVGAQQSFSLVYYCHNGFKAVDSMKSHILLICIQVHQIKDTMGGTCRAHGRYDKPIFVFCLELLRNRPIRRPRCRVPQETWNK